MFMCTPDRYFGILDEQLIQVWRAYYYVDVLVVRYNGVLDEQRSYIYVYRMRSIYILGSI